MLILFSGIVDPRIVVGNKYRSDVMSFDRSLCSLLQCVGFKYPSHFFRVTRRATYTTMVVTRCPSCYRPYLGPDDWLDDTLLHDCICGHHITIYITPLPLRTCVLDTISLPNWF